jgi:hypothetical protein
VTVWVLENTVLVANVGDSKAVLARTADKVWCTAKEDAWHNSWLQTFCPHFEQPGYGYTRGMAAAQQIGGRIILP